MKESEISKIDIAKFLPHRKPLVMVSAIVDISENHVVTRFHISEECIFIKNRRLTESGIIENAAQTATGVVGQTFFDRNDLSGSNKKLIGYISAIKKIAIDELPKIGDTIETEAHLISRYDTGAVTMCSLRSQTFLKKKLIVSSVMNFLIHEI